MKASYALRAVVQVYSDVEIRYPTAYANAVLKGKEEFWNVVDVTGSCLTIESKSPYYVRPDETADSVFANILPDTYDNTEVRFVPINSEVK